MGSERQNNWSLFVLVVTRCALLDSVALYGQVLELETLCSSTITSLKTVVEETVRSDFTRVMQEARLLLPVVQVRSPVLERERNYNPRKCLSTIQQSISF